MAGETKNGNALKKNLKIGEQVTKSRMEKAELKL